jgi:hypothetical protein
MKHLKKFNHVQTFERFLNESTMSVYQTAISYGLNPEGTESNFVIKRTGPSATKAQDEIHFRKESNGKWDVSWWSGGDSNDSDTYTEKEVMVMLDNEKSAIIDL